MADKMYAWTNFPVEYNEYAQPTKTIKAGEEVTKEALKVSDEDWDEYVRIGSVRAEEYPDIPDGMAPAEYVKLNQEEKDALAKQDIVEEVTTRATSPGAPTPPADKKTEDKKAEDRKVEDK